MKRHHSIISAILLVIIALTSCKKNFEQVNTDPINIPYALPEQLLAPAMYSSLGTVMSRNRSFNNELMQITVSETDNDGAVFRYDYRNSVSDGVWNGLYAQLTNFKDVYTIAGKAPNTNTSYQGISLVMQAWIYSILTDIYGDIPFSQSNLARDSSIYLPKFDKQKDVYQGMFNMLEQANALLAKNVAIKAAADPIYHGSVSGWRKFCNSLYLRLLLRVSGKSEVSADVIAKIQDMVDVHASTYPRMGSNTDNAVMKWSTSPLISPYQTTREQDWRSPAICKFFIDHLVAWADPRIDITTYGTSGINRWGIAQGHSGFAGVASGYAPGSGDPKESYFYSNTSAVSLQNDPSTGILMTYAELNFILAECKLKGYISTGVTQTYWETGVLNSITYWLPFYPNPTASGAPSTTTTINTAQFRAYLTNADIDWDETESMEDKLEHIHLQKYYALFLTDLQQWFEYRRTGHPILPKGNGLKNGGVMPARMDYPVYVQSANPTGYTAAVADQGPDKISTQVWWQKP